MTDDQAVRERALKADESFIVQAPAGSGKTELLIQRYLNLLGAVAEPEEIVAITFTRKAAAEMRERVLEALRGAAAGHYGRDALEARRFELARHALENDRRFGWELAHHPARLQIQTIDSFCLALTRQLPVLSGFGAPSGILEDQGAAYHDTAVQTLQLLGGGNRVWDEALRTLLLHLDNDMARASALIASMLASRDQWLRHLGAGAVAPESLESAWRQVIESWLRRAGDGFPGELAAAVAKCADEAAAQLVAAGDAPEARAWLSGAGFPGANVGELARWRFLAGLLVIQSDAQWRKQVNKKQGFPPQSTVKRTMQEVLAALDGNDDLARVLFTVRSLPDPDFDAGKREVLDAMVTVLRLAVAQLQLDFEARAQVDFVEITQRAIHALGSLDDPSDLALKLDYRISHLLVDEFQDTSMAQHHLLRQITQGWTPGDGRTLFLVGDPMQSIYRFREAEVGIFLNVWENGLGTVPLHSLRLESNFRSAPTVVSWVNEAFAGCFPPASDWRVGAVAYAPSTPRRAGPGEGGCVEVHPFVDTTDSGQAERLAGLIGEALQRTSDVAVLVRARSHLRALLPALQARGIPYSGMDITALVNEPAVRDLYSLTRALLHPGDRMAWLSLLRAPWCGLVLADLLTVASYGAEIWRALQDARLRQALSDDGRDRVDRTRRALAGALGQRGRLTLRQWVRRAWLALGGPAVIDPGEMDHVHAYLDLLGRHQSGMHLADADAFEEALQGLWAHAESRAGAVQLMTIHRAKGLEFDEVFLPGLERSSRSDEKRLLLWEEPVDGDGLLLATLSQRGAPDDLHYRYLRGLQSEKAAQETNRLLYVACTRARERLHLLGKVERGEDGGLKPPERGSLLRRLWPSVESRFRSAAQADAGVDGAVARRGGEPLLRRLPAQWRPPDWPDPLHAAEVPPVDERRVEFAWVGETARQVGILVHELIQHMAREGLDAWSEDRIAALKPAWRRQLEHAGVAAGELDAAVNRGAEAMRNMLRDERAEWLLAGSHREAANEHELSVLVEGRVRRLRMDRTFIDEHGVRWIVDYKTSAHEGGEREAFLDEEVRRYAPQMTVYGDAFRKMEDREIRLALYFPLLGGWREWTYQDA